MKVGLAQIDPHPVDVESNMRIHRDCIRQAIRQKADLIVFPELSLTGDKIGPFIEDVGLTLESEPVLEIGELSQEIDIVIGLVERGVNLYNRFNAAFYFSQGGLIHRHRKLLLVNYAVFEEGKHYVPGHNLQAFDGRLGRACMLICNDPWHAAMPYIAALDGAETLIVPANSARGTLKEYLNIPQTWEHMNRAYSASMGFYTVFVNRVGQRKDEHGEFTYWGGSEIIDPRGEVVVKAPYDEQALIFGEVDLERVAEQRYYAPLLRDARLWIIQQEIDRLAAKRSSAGVLGDEGLPVAPEGTSGGPADGESGIA